MNGWIRSALKCTEYLFGTQIDTNSYGQKLECVQEQVVKCWC